MKRLDKTQLNLLNKIRKTGDYNCSNISESELSIIKYLRSEGFLTAKTRDGFFPSGMHQGSRIEIELLSVKLSETGKAYLAELHTDKTRWCIPLFISIFAAIGAYRAELAYILQKLAQLLK